jgi:hypothetical protein
VWREAAPARLTKVRLADRSVRRGRALVLRLAASAPMTVRVTVDGRRSRTVALTRTRTLRISTRKLARGGHRLRISAPAVNARTVRFRIVG